MVKIKMPPLPKPFTEGEVWTRPVCTVTEVTTRELQDELFRQAAEAADKRVREIFKGE